MEATQYLYPAFTFRTQQKTEKLVEIAAQHDVDLAYWQPVPDEAHLYAYQVPFQGYEGGLDEQIYNTVTTLRLAREIGDFALGYAAEDEWLRYPLQILHRSKRHSELLSISWLPPWMNSHCQCGGNFWCMVGHSMECHFPLDCGSAGCGHLQKYDYTLEQAAQLQVRSREILLTIADPECEGCKGSGIYQVDTTAKELMTHPSTTAKGSGLVGVHEAVGQLAGDLDTPITIKTVCECIMHTLLNPPKSQSGG